MLRGVNLSGATKMPTSPAWRTHHPATDEFYQHRAVSFTGRPFPLAEADEHFRRLHQWGFNFLRFQITWEAVEHAGPGKYDTEYVEYVVQVLLKAKQYGFKCFIDPHQDVWSRYTGGSGAPGWTLELVGFDLRKLKQTGAALVQNEHDEPSKFPKMIWPTNYFKLACSTMFTLFFGGKVFAPRCVVVEEQERMVILDDKEYEEFLRTGRVSGYHGATLTNIQDFLQRCYLGSVKALIQEITRHPDLVDSVVCGYDTLNEPSGGYLGTEDLSQFPHHQTLKHGLTPTPLQTMLLGEGITCPVEVWEFGWLGPYKAGTTPVNVEGVRVWRDGYTCPWLAHGLYDNETRMAIKPDYFYRHPGNGSHIDWIHQFWKPFVRAFTQTIRSAHQHAIIFVEPPVNEQPPLWNPEDGDPTDRICYTPHWYDGITLMNKTFSSLWTVDYIGYIRGKYWNILGALSFGYGGIKNNFSRQLCLIKDEGTTYLGDTPCLIGEIGIPYDMDGKAAYKPGGAAYKKQILAMNANMTALERNLLNFTLWNYCPDNGHQWGDLWNGEDLSIWSKDDAHRPDALGFPEEAEKRRRKSRVRFSTLDDTVDSLESIESNPLVDLSDPRNEPTPNASALSGRRLSPAGTLPIEPSATSQHARSKTTPARLLAPELDKGARALAAFLRPYPMRTLGTPIHVSFDQQSKSKTFTFLFKNDRSVPSQLLAGQGTEIFVPLRHFGLPLEAAMYSNGLFKKNKPTPTGYFSLERQGEEQVLFDLDDECDMDELFFEVAVSDGHWTYDPARQLVHYFHADTRGLDGSYVKELPEGTSPVGVHRVTIQVCSRKRVKTAVSMKTGKKSRSSKARMCAIL